MADSGAADVGQMSPFETGSTKGDQVTIKQNIISNDRMSIIIYFNYVFTLSSHCFISL